MNIAVIYSGLLRRPIQNFGSLKKFRSFSDIQFDIYFCCWNDRNHNSLNPDRLAEGNTKLEKFLVGKIYRPVVLKLSPIESWGIQDIDMAYEQIVNKYPWSLVSGKLMPNFLEHLLSNNISMWKSIYDGFSLMEDHMKLTGRKTYDYVVRARTDVFPHDSILDLLGGLTEELEILVPESRNHPGNEINDWFALGSFNAMKIYCSLFQEIEIVMNECLRTHKYWTNEAGLYMYLNKQKIKVKKKPLNLNFK